MCWGKQQMRPIFITIGIHPKTKGIRNTVGAQKATMAPCANTARQNAETDIVLMDPSVSKRREQMVNRISIVTVLQPTQTMQNMPEGFVNTKQQASARLHNNMTQPSFVSTMEDAKKTFTKDVIAMRHIRAFLASLESQPGIAHLQSPPSLLLAVILPQ